jgi:hypothetical protein
LNMLANYKNSPLSSLARTELILTDNYYIEYRRTNSPSPLHQY